MTATPEVVDMLINSLWSSYSALQVSRCAFRKIVKKDDDVASRRRAALHRPAILRRRKVERVGAIGEELDATAQLPFRSSSEM